MPEMVEILDQLKKLKGISTGSASVTVASTAPVTGTVTVGVSLPLTVLRVGQITVGATTSKALTSSCTSKCVALFPHSANTGRVYFGYSSAVTTSNGCELGSPVSLALDNANKVHVIANIASQKVCWAVLR